MSSSTVRVAVAALAVATTLALTAGPAPASPVVALSVDFNELAVGTPITAPLLGGAAASGLASTVLTEGGPDGVAMTGENPSDPSAGALRLPAYAALNRPNTPLAITRITNATPVDRLEIGMSDFSFQADFSLDLDTGTDITDGNNIVQRGLSGSVQWKLSADRRHVQCFMRTASGLAINTPIVSISDTAWYRATCARTTTTASTATLTLTVQRWDGTRFAAFAPVRVSKGNAYGAMTFSAASIPVTIGGKVTNKGVLHNHPDQFNGSIDNVALRIG